MTPTERFSVLLTILSILTTAMLTIAGVAIRDHYNLRDLMNDVGQLVQRKENDHKTINERLTQLERDQLDFYRKRMR